jgi:uncharacterized protein (TIGR00266 family)
LIERYSPSTQWREAEGETVDTKIIGTTLPVLEVTLNPGESIISESGEMSWMTQSVEMRTHTQAAGGGGLFGAIKRVAGGGSLFMTEYTAERTAGMVAFSTKLPGEIVPVQLDGRQTYLLHRHGFICGTSDVVLGVGFQQRLGAGVFGGDGFRLQKLEGRGQAWIELSGEMVTYDLQPGETLRVIPGHVAMFEAEVTFGITRIKGIRNIMFGADALFLAELTGPGKVWIQSLTVAGIAHALQPYLTTGEAESGAAGGIIGAALKGMS